MIGTDLEAATNRARATIRECDNLIVALSGGVDSAVLLALAIEVLGTDRVLAVTGRSGSLAADDLESARAVARALGARHQVIETRELERPEYRENAGDRCFHCRTELFEVLGRLARRLGFRAIAYGAIKDDEGDFRPGMEAARRFGVKAPLLEAGIGKSEVRELARRAGLPVSDKPAAACLASRIPVGVEVTPERLARVERAESALRKLGFGQFRVRYHGAVARLELDEAGERKLAGPGMRGRVAEVVRSAGFRFVAVDLDGYRSGSLNPAAKLYRIDPARSGGQ